MLLNHFDPFNEGDNIDPIDWDDVTQDLLEQLLKKFLAKVGAKNLSKRLTDLFPTGSEVEGWIDRIVLQVGYDVECTRYDCIETSSFHRFLRSCFGYKVNKTIWTQSNFDCGGPYWLDVVATKAGNNTKVGDAESVTFSDIIKRIMELKEDGKWRIKDNATFITIQGLMHQEVSFPGGCDFTWY